MYLQGALEAGAELPAQQLQMVGVFAGKAHRPAQQVVGLLVHPEGVLVVDDLVVGEVVDFLQLAAGADGHPLAAEDVLVPAVVPLPVQLGTPPGENPSRRRSPRPKNWASVRLRPASMIWFHWAVPAPGCKNMGQTFFLMPPSGVWAKPQVPKKGGWVGIQMKRQGLSRI